MANQFPPSQRLVTEATLQTQVASELAKDPTLVEAATQAAGPGVDAAVHARDLLISPQVGRIIAVADGDPVPALAEGDLLVRYAVPGVSYFTDFTGYTVGQQPADWSQPWAAGTWTVVENADGTGGVVLRKAATPYVARGAIVWDAVGADPDRGDVEILMRWRGVPGASGAGWVGALARATGAAGTETAYRGGVRDEPRQAIYRYVGGALQNTTDSTQGAPFTVDTWFMTRFRVSGSVQQLKTWRAADSEPAAWHVEVTNGSIAAPGKVGFFNGSTGIQDVDWVAVATGGRTAARP